MQTVCSRCSLLFFECLGTRLQCLYLPCRSALICSRKVYRIAGYFRGVLIFVIFGGLSRSNLPPEVKCPPDESVQILHSGGNHWITISTVGTKHPTVKIFDSLYNELPWETKEQIAALLQTKESAITLEFANVQVKTIILLIVSTIVDARVSISNRNREMELTAGCLPLLLQWQSAMGKTRRN